MLWPHTKTLTFEKHIYIYCTTARYIADKPALANLVIYLICITSFLPLE